MFQKSILCVFLSFMALTYVKAQDDNPFITYDVPSQNLLKYNRFLINPTFSTVREDKSYINLLHRNQSVSFDDNTQAYFLSYSGRISDRTGLGLSVYNQREGLISNFGVLANYAYGVKLSDKSNFTFGANMSYYNSSFDRNRANPIEDDPLLAGFQSSSLISFQPGFNISYGKFDFGLFAENLFDYNLRTSESVSEFKDKTFSGHFQYTHSFENASGLLQSGRLMPLARLRKVGENEVVLGGSLILDLPKLGWVQGGYDSFYGAAAGVGFNLNRRISIGYTMEKGLSNNFNNFGLTHEISFAYSFTPNLTEDRVMLENDREEELVEKALLPEEVFTSKDEEIAELKRRLAENDEILAELMFRQDSIEANRQKDLERRFEMVMRMVKRETDGKRPDLEEQARQTYFINNDQADLVQNTNPSNTLKPIGIQEFQKTAAANESFNASESSNNSAKTKDAVVVVDREINQPVAAAETADETDEFTKATRQLNVKSKKFRNLQGVEDGYYVVANVYKGGEYLNKFIAHLNKQGIKAAYFTNPANGLKYVYIERFDNWQDALATYTSKVNGTYTGELWIMNVDNSLPTDTSYVANVNKIKEKAAKYDADALQKNVIVKDNVTANTPTSSTVKIDGVGTGYYIIVNVFANQNNANRFVKLLNSRGLNAGYFTNPENNYKYVYLKKHDSWNTALISYYTKLNDTYDDKMWIMRVTPNLLT